MTEQEIEALKVELENGGKADCETARIMRQALTAIRQLQQPWRGMESANTSVNSPWVIGTDGQNSAPMKWAVECDDERYTGWCGAFECSGGSLYYDHIPLGFQPTAWMPLPTPPETGQ